MLFVDKMHQNTADLRYEGKNTRGQNIIIDAAEIRPGQFEVMAMWPNGLDFDFVTVYTLEDAKKTYKKMLKKYTKPQKPEGPPAPLSGKYAKLRDDLREALQAGRHAETCNPEDGGSCNFDSAALHLPRWKKELIQQAAREANTSCFTWNCFGEKLYVFRPDTFSQGNARSRNAEAMTRALSRMGYDAMDYCQAD